MQKIFLFFTIAWILIIAGCGESNISSQRYITVSILPQKYFVQKIAGDRFPVNVMIPPGYSPHTYSPTPRQMKEWSSSFVYFMIGHLPCEKAWMEKIAPNNPQMKLVDTSAGVDLIYGQHDCGLQDEHEDHDHAHGIVADPHIWLSPKAVKIQARHIVESLILLDPSQQSFYQSNYEQFCKEIEELDQKISTILKPAAGKKFMVYHPAWSYFARDYNLIQLPIEIEGKKPHPADLKKIIETAKKEKIKIIFVQKQFDMSNAQAVASEIGAMVVALDPLEWDWKKNMENIAESIRNSLRE